MKIAGVIAEFNPFHNGHQYFLEEVRRQSGADYIVALMSGDFVQRGTPAIFSKYIRAEMALAGGADLVCELPLIAACSSAERFARGGAAVLENLGCVDELWFGSECGNLDILRRFSDLFSQEPESFREVLKAELKKGHPYPAARARAASACLAASEASSDTDALSSALSEPNNILGMEYIRALTRIGSGIRPCTLKRRGSAYADPELNKEMSYSSAAAIRKLLLSKSDTDPALLKNQIPKSVYSILQKNPESCPPITEDDFSDMLIYQLLRESPESLTSYLDVSYDLARRICNLRGSFTSFSQFADLVKTRNLTRTAVNRALLHILLGLRCEEQSDFSDLSGVHLLGFRSDSRPLLSQISKCSRIPLMARRADLPADKSSRFCRTSCFAYNLYETVRARKAGQAFTAEASRPFIRYDKPSE